MKIKIFKNSLGEVTRIGLYNEIGKWIKWLPKKKFEEYKNKVESIEEVIE